MRSPRELERGQASEAVVIFPLVLGLIFLIIQLGLWGYARSIAVHAAREGATAAAAYESDQSPQDVTTAALADSADGIFHSYAVSSSTSADAITVTVRGQALSLVPFVDLPGIEQSVTVPTETYVP